MAASGQPHQHEHDQIEHAGEEQPRVAFVGLEPETGKDRQEGAAQRAAGHKLKEQVGHAEGSQIGVVGRAGAEAVAEDDFARQTGHAAEDEKDHDQQRGAQHAPAIQPDRLAGLLRLFGLDGHAHVRDYRARSGKVRIARDEGTRGVRLW